MNFALVYLYFVVIYMTIKIKTVVNYPIYIIYDFFFFKVKGELMVSLCPFSGSFKKFIEITNERVGYYAYQNSNMRVDRNKNFI